MYFEISAVVAVIIFAVLSFYVIQTLLRFQKTLAKIDLLTLDMNHKAKTLDSTLNALSNLGDICDTKTAQLRNDLHIKKETEVVQGDYSDDIADLLLVGLRIGSKYFTRRK